MKAHKDVRVRIHKSITRAAISRAVGIMALATTSLTASCVTSTESADDKTLIAAMKPTSSADTTYVSDTLLFKGPLLTNTNGNTVTDLKVRWETSRPDIVRLISSPESKYTGQAQVGLESGFSPAEVRLEAVAPGEAVITMTPLDVGFVNGQSLRYQATVVVRASRPTILDLQSSYTVRLGDTLPLVASPRGSSPGIFTTGSVDWRLTDERVARMIRPSSGVISAGTDRPWLETLVPTSVRFETLAIGSTPLTVTYRGAAGVVLVKNVTINVIPNAARVQIDRGVESQFVDVANEQIAIDARLLNAAGQAVNPAALRFTIRDSATFTMRAKGAACTDVAALVCGVFVSANNAELLRRGVVKTWVVASAGPGVVDSVEITFYPAVASFAITPSPTTMALGAATDFTVVARDANGGAIPAAAFPKAIPIERDQRVPSASVGLALIARPPMVTNIAIASLTAPTATVVVRAGRQFGTQLIEAVGTINVRTVNSIVITPPTATHRIGTTGVTFTAQLLDGAGRPVLDPTIRPAWTTADSTIAGVSATTDRSATVVGTRAGNTNVIASVQGVTASASLEVTGALVNPTIAVSPADVPLEVGQRATLTAAVGNVATPSAVDWVSRNPAIASITPSGLTTAVDALTVGTTYIVASYTAGGTTVRDSARVRVSAVPSRVRFMVLEPRNAEITVPSSVQYRVVLFDSTGTIVTEPGGVVTYTSTPTTVARMTGSTAAGFSGGTATIRATYSFGGQTILSDETPLLVYPATAGHLGSVEISTAANERKVRVGETLLFQVIIRDVNGAQIRSGAAGFSYGPLNSPYVDIERATDLPDGYFFRIRGKAATPTVGSSPAGVVLIRADVTGAGASIPIVVLR